MRRVRMFISTAALLMSVGALAGNLSAQSPASQPSGDAELVDTFVLSPIQSQALSLEVPASFMEPVKNGSCRDWTDRPASCYLPAQILSEEPSGGPAKSMYRMLERHTSSMLGAWKAASWPASGGNFAYNLVRGATLEHCWLATRIELTETIKGSWLTAQGDAGLLPWQAEGQPDAMFKLEVFDEVHDAGGFPRVTGP